MKREKRIIDSTLEIKPVNNEPIIPLDDFPRHLYSNYKADNHSKDVFIVADFLLKEIFQEEIAKELKCDTEQIKRVLVKRRYDGRYHITFPYSKVENYETETLRELLESFESYLYSSETFLKESTDLQVSIKAFLKSKTEKFPQDIFSKNHALEVK